MDIRSVGTLRNFTPAGLNAPLVSEREEVSSSFQPQAGPLLVEAVAGTGRAVRQRPLAKLRRAFTPARRRDNQKRVGNE